MKPSNSVYLCILCFNLVLTAFANPSIGQTSTVSNRRIFFIVNLGRTSSGLTEYDIGSVLEDGSGFLLYPIRDINEYNPQLSPSHDVLFFIGQANDLSMNLYSMNLEKRTFKKHFRVGNSIFFSIFPSGKQFLVTGQPSGFEVRDLSGDLIRKFEDGWNATLSADGKKIAFVKATKTRDVSWGTEYLEQDYFIMNSDGTDQRQVSFDGRRKGNFSLSRNGSFLVYTQDKSAESIGVDYRSEIYLVNTKTGKKLQITDNERAEADPSWSPDDRSILFCSGRRIMLIDIMEKKEKIIYEATMFVHAPWMATTH